MSLNKKFDIIREGSWKNSITARMNDLISPRSPHYEKMIERDDENFLKIIDDVQSRIREKKNKNALEVNEKNKQGKKKGKRERNGSEKNVVISVKFNLLGVYLSCSNYFIMWRKKKKREKSPRFLFRVQQKGIAAAFLGYLPWVLAPLDRHSTKPSGLI